LLAANTVPECKQPGQKSLYPTLPAHRVPRLCRRCLPFPFPNREPRSGMIPQIKRNGCSQPIGTLQQLSLPDLSFGVDFLNNAYRGWEIYAELLKWRQMRAKGKEQGAGRSGELILPCPLSLATCNF
jgi:hypothetical protein